MKRPQQAAPLPVLFGVNTKHKGVASELKALVFLHENRYSVSLPYGENCPYDLIAESPAGKIYRVQCRTLRRVKDALILSLRCCSKNYHRPVNFERIDAFMGIYGDRVFIIPTRIVLGKGEFSIRLTEAKNGQKRKINHAILFEGALDTLLP